MPDSFTLSDISANVPSIYDVVTKGCYVTKGGAIAPAYMLCYLLLGCL